MPRSTRSPEVLALIAWVAIVSIPANSLHGQGAGGALLFDGANDIATVMDEFGDFDLGPAFTVEVWVRLDAPSTGGGAVGGVTSGGGGAWILGESISSPPDLILSVSTPFTDAVFCPAFPLGVWTHIAGTYDSATMTVFMNGAWWGWRPTPLRARPPTWRRWSSDAFP